MSASLTTEPAVPAKAPKAPKKTGSHNDDDTGHDKTLNLYQRIQGVMNDIKRLQKDKAVGGGGNFGYKAMSEEKVVTEVRAAMLRHGLVIFPIEQAHKLVDYSRASGGKDTIVSLTTVDVRYKLVNVDKPEEFEIIVSSGTGTDTQDKGVGKAMTYAMKYALLRTFMIPTGADPDDVHNDDLSNEQEAAARPAMRVVSSEPEQPAAPVQYASASQKENIIRLLNHPLVTKQERTKMLLGINRLDEERATEAITKLNRAIEDRGNDPTYVADITK